MKLINSNIHLFCFIVMLALASVNLWYAFAWVLFLGWLLHNGKQQD